MRFSSSWLYLFLPVLLTCGGSGDDVPGGTADDGGGCAGSSSGHRDPFPIKCNPPGTGITGKGNFATKACSPDGFCWQNPLPMFDEMNHIAARTANDVWMVGDNATILRWDGTAWRRHQPARAEAFRAIYGLADNDAWVVGSHGSIQHWDGAVWSESPSGVTNELRSVWGSAADDVWAVGDGPVLHWDGTTWTVVPVATVVQPAGFLSVRGAGKNDVWFTGQQTTAHWDGSALREQIMPWVNGTKLWVNSGSDAWVISGPYIFRWNGSTWTKDAYTAKPGYYFLDIWGSSASDVWVVGYTEFAHWDGTTWTAIPFRWYGKALGGTAGGPLWIGGRASGLIGYWDGTKIVEPDLYNSSNLLSAGLGLTAAWGSGADNVWASVAYQNSFYGYLLHWDGRAWSRPEPRIGGGPLWGTSPTNLWTSGWHYNGKEWQPFTPPMTITTMHGSAADDMWASGGRVVRSSNPHVPDMVFYESYHWDGASFRLEPTLKRALSIWCASATSAWAAVDETLGSASGGPIYQYDGSKWALSVPRVMVRKIRGSSPSNVWAVGDKTILRWDGKAWAEVGGGRGGVDVWPVSATDVWVVGADGVLHWDGMTWQALNSGRTSELQAVYAPDAKHVWLFGDSLSIIARDCSAGP